MKPPHATDTLNDPRWAQLLARQPAASFVYAVTTTGVYAWPGSPAKLPRPEHVVFFDTPGQAEAAGFRPSRRALQAQQERHAASVTKACQLIEQSDSLPELAELAAGVGMSRFHFHRVFKAVTGMTPAAYAKAARRTRVREHLNHSATVTDALYQAGFASNSRFYESASGMLGMPPQVYRAGGVAVDIHFAVGECKLGSILVAQSDKGICAILLGDDPQRLVHDLHDQFPNANLLGADPAFEQQVALVVGFVEAPALGLALPLDIRGTLFQERVWQALRDIPAGTTVTYAQLATRIGQPSATRAVANACGANALAVAIPCHRVVRSDGSASGYRWGVERKQQLLALEQCPPAT